MRDGSGLNHYAKGIDVALITGAEVTALCGSKFVPTLRVGSGGMADEPAWAVCDVCERIDGLMAEMDRLKQIRNEAARELRAVESEAYALGGEGRGLTPAEARRRVKFKPSLPSKDPSREKVDS